MNGCLGGDAAGVLVFRRRCPLLPASTTPLPGRLGRLHLRALLRLELLDTARAWSSSSEDE